MNEIKFRTLCANFVITATLLLSFAVAFVASYPTKTDVLAVNNAIYEGNKQSAKVALTFNVYENTQNVLAIAKILEEHGAKATFFVGGCWLAKNADTALKLASNGFEIGNHGYSHRDHAKLNQKGNADEIRVTERLIDNALSSLPDYANCKLFAPPSGSIGDDMFAVCKDMGYKVIMWTRDTIDWRDHDAELIFKRATRDLKAGDIVLMHPTDMTVKALPEILEYIRSQGLTADIVSMVI